MELVRLSDTEILTIIQGIVSENTAVPPGNGVNITVSKSLASRKWVSMSNLVSPLAFGAQTRIMGPDPGAAANFANQPYYLGYITHSVANSAAATDVTYAIIAMSSSDNANPVPTVTRSFARTLNPQVWATPAMARLEDSIPFPILFQSLYVDISAGTTGAWRYQMHFEGWQVFVK